MSVLKTDSEAALYWRLQARWLRAEAAQQKFEHRAEEYIQAAKRAEALEQEFEASHRRTMKHEQA